jgi:hypothetical protein
LAQVCVRTGLREPLASVPGGGESSLVKRACLVPVALTGHEAVHGGRDGGRVVMPVAEGRVVGCAVEVKAFGLHPGDRLFPRRQNWGTCWWCAEDGGHSSGRAPGQVTVGGTSGMQVVIQEPDHSGVTLGGRVGPGHGSGVLPDEVVEGVAAPGGLVGQVEAEQVIEQPAGSGQAGVIQGGRGVGVDVGAGVQAEAAEQMLRACGKVAVGQAERDGDRVVLRSHRGEPVGG